MTEAFSIRKEGPEDYLDIAQLQAEAFEDETAIPNMVDDLRGLKGAFPTTSLVAVSEAGQVCGHIMLSHAWVDGPKRMIDVLVLSPLGVRPAHQNIGIGTALIKAALEEARALGAPMVFLEGNPRYYGPRGFEKATDLGFRRPSVRIPEGAFQVALLTGVSDDMKGTFVYRDVHWQHGVGLYRD